MSVDAHGLITAYDATRGAVEDEMLLLLLVLVRLDRRAGWERKKNRHEKLGASAAAHVHPGSSEHGSLGVVVTSLLVFFLSRGEAPRASEGGTIGTEGQ